MSDGMRFEHRLSDSDALMWHIEKDPLLRSTITVVWWLDAPPDRERHALQLPRPRAPRDLDRPGRRARPESFVACLADGFAEVVGA